MWLPAIWEAQWQRDALFFISVNPFQVISLVNSSKFLYCQSYFDLVTFYDPSPVFSSSFGLKLAWPDDFDDSEPQNPKKAQRWHTPDFANTEEGRAEEHLWWKIFWMALLPLSSHFIFNIDFVLQPSSPFFPFGTFTPGFFPVISN